ncbi:hypothetical protein M3Y94_00292000 [Aphelenchoides besseyi]|nr:hypothetical protein M3Y94_00292000 [Aphelenchoides besseyi]
MSRGNDLTCNESLPDDGAGGVSNFSPSTNRTYMSQAPQLFNTNTVDSLAALRDRILQQQPNAQHATSVLQQLQQRNATISTLLSQPGVSGVEALVNQLNQQASTVTADSLLSQLQFLQNRQQQQVASQQLLDNLPSAATLTAALVAQQNIYGALPQLASNLASLNNANVSAEQNARLAAIQQIAASVVGLNVGQPQQSGYLSDNLELPRTNTLAQQLAQVQQRAQVQQHHQHVQAVQNATSSYLNDQNTLQQQAAVSRQSSFANVQQQLLLSNSLYSARNPTSSSAATPQLTQQQISDFLASQQQIPTSRLSDDLARQQLYQAQSQLNQQRSQAETMIAQSSGAYQSLNGGQVNTETPQIGQLLQQYLSRLTSNYGQATSIEKDRENVAAQLQQLGFPDAGHQSTVSPLNFQPSTSQSLNRVPVIGSSTQTHSIVPLQQQSLQQMATALQNESLQLRLQQELQQTAKLAQSSSSLPNNLAASQLAYSQAAVVDRQTPSSPSRNLKRSRPSSSVLSNSQNAASILASASQSNSNLTAENAATRLGRSLLPEELLVLDRARNAAYNMTNIPASTNYSSSHNETASELLLRQHALERQRHHIEPEILEQRRTHASDSNDQTAEGSSTQKGSNQVEHVSTDENRLPNIPTLAAFRQVPGQDLFDHFPKKRIKQDQLGVPDVDIDSAETHRKKNSAEVQLLTSRSKKEFQKQSQLRSPQKFGENVKRDKQVDSVAALGDLVDISVPRKRGRPRTNFTKEKKSTIKSTRSGSTKDDESVDRTILHDAADFFLKPTLPNNQTHSSAVSPAGNRKRVGRKLKDVDQNVVSKINSLAAAITLADEDESMVSEEKRKKSKKASETARSTTQIHNIQELVEKNPVLRNLSNEEVVGVQALLKYYAENEAHNDVEMPEIVKEIASAAGLWEALELTLDSPDSKRAKYSRLCLQQTASDGVVNDGKTSCAFQ